MNSFDASFFRPKSPGEVVKGAFGACFAKGGAAFTTAVVMMLPATALSLAFLYLMGRMGVMDTLMSLQGGQFDPTKLDMRAFMGDMLVLGGGGLVVGVASVLSMFAAAAAVGRMLAERALGREFTAFQAWDFVAGKLFRLIGGGIVAGFVLVLGYIIAAIPAGVVNIILAAATGGMKPGAPPSPLMQIVPAIIVLPVMAAVGAYLASMPSVVGVEDMGGISAVFRSLRLVSGQFWDAVASIALGGLILLGPSIVIQMALQYGLLDAVTKLVGGQNAMLAAGAPGSVLSLVGWPIMMTLQALLYFDLRSRQTEDEFTPYELTLEVGGELPEGVQDPFASDSPSPPIVP